MVKLIYQQHYLTEGFAMAVIRSQSVTCRFDKCSKKALLLSMFYIFNRYFNFCREDKFKFYVLVGTFIMYIVLSASYYELNCFFSIVCYVINFSVDVTLEI